MLDFPTHSERQLNPFRLWPQLDKRAGALQKDANGNRLNQHRTQSFSKGQHGFKNWSFPFWPVGRKVRFDAHGRSTHMPLPIPSERALTFRTNPQHHGPILHVARTILWNVASGAPESH
jgi:hypothetical protein